MKRGPPCTPPSASTLESCGAEAPCGCRPRRGATRSSPRSPGRSEGHLVRGLELAEKTLEREARGLSLVDARSATERGVRVSRLVIVGNDGTERFYRQVERLALKHGPRLLAIWVDADSEQLGAAVPHAAGVVRALMLEHKDDVVRVLLALYERHADARGKG